MMTKQDLKEQIFKEIDLITIIKQSGVKLTSDGTGKYVGAHENKHDSENGKCLNVDKSGVWHCFHCHEGGDVLDWIASDNNLNIKRNFTKILHIAADMCGIEIKKEKKIDKRETEGSVFDCISDSVDYYQGNITEKLYKYIYKQWGINKESVDKYKIGYSRTGLYNYLINLGYNKNQILKTGLFTKFGKSEIIEVLEKRIIFPYLDNNNPVYMIGRNTFNDNRPKYVKLPVNNKRKNYISEQVKNVIFGIDSFVGVDHRFCLITEGVTDCIMSHQNDIPTISPVTVQFRKKDSEIVYEWVKDFETIYICNDNEVNQAGLEGAKAIAWSLIEKGLEVKLVTLPKDEGVNKIDVAEYLRDHTKEEFLNVLKTGQDPMRDYVPSPEDFLTEQGGFKHREFAEWLMKHSKYRFINFRDNPKDVYYYKNGIYVPYGIATAQTVIESIMDGYVNNNNVKEVIGHIMRGSVINREDICKDTFVINVLNGMVEIKNGGIEFRDHSPDYYSFNQLNVEYYDDATSQLWDKFITDIQPDSKNSYKTMKMLAYSLIPDWSQQKWFMLLGKEGGNGKSVLLRVIRDLLGDKNCSAVPIQDLQSTFKGARLYMKLANIASDVQERKMKHFDIVKSLTGGDPIEIEMKYKDSFDYINVATLMFSMNMMPMLDEILDGATKRRMMVLEFNEIFRGEAADKNMFNKLTTSEEKSGIFLQLCNILVDHYVDGHITLFDDVSDDDAFQVYNKNRYADTHKWLKDNIHITGDRDDRLAIGDIRDEILQYVDEIKKLPKKDQLHVVRNLLNFEGVIHDSKLTTKNVKGKQNLAIGGIEWNV